jgi:rhodanese-related sulfurtransferase
MKRLIAAFLILLASINQIKAQYRYDNKLFKNMYWDELCRELEKHDGHLLLDVRSKGEFSDTSQYGGFNIGRLKGSINIDIRQLADSISRLDAYKDKPIYIYCSHSQRSRRASKLLSEKGFKNVININGGMTMFNNLKNSGISCEQSIFETSVPYTLLSPADICNLLKTDKNIFILDVRKDSAFNGISAEEHENGYGKFRQAVNIPLSALENETDKIPHNKTIIITDEFGNLSPKAAKILIEKGFKNVNILFDGLENWAGSDPSTIVCKNQWVYRENHYQLVSGEEFDQLCTKNSDILILDVRGDSVFNNRAKDYWRNVGQIKNAINIPFNELNDKVEQINQYKNKPVVVYAFSSSPEAFSSAKLLTEKGFSNVSVLVGGIFDLRWVAANVKDHQYLNKWVTNVPADNY